MAVEELNALVLAQMKIRVNNLTPLSHNSEIIPCYLCANMNCLIDQVLAYLITINEYVV